MTVDRVATFVDGIDGGNPAGVVIAEQRPAASRMQGIAAELRYSETVFAALAPDGWRSRCFAPAMEVPFCGHATIALGAVLASSQGPRTYPLHLNGGRMLVSGWVDECGFGATLTSPTTSSRASAFLFRVR
ncbi:PhzF family phenazine biosynthesis protein [Sphingomonas sp. UYP23]